MSCTEEATPRPHESPSYEALEVEWDATKEESALDDVKKHVVAVLGAFDQGSM